MLIIDSCLKTVQPAVKPAFKIKFDYSLQAFFLYYKHIGNGCTYHFRKPFVHV